MLNLMLKVYFGERNKKRTVTKGACFRGPSNGVSRCLGSQLSDSKTGIDSRSRGRSRSGARINGRGHVCSSRWLFSEGLWKGEEVRDSGEEEREERQSRLHRLSARPESSSIVCSQR